MPTYLTFGWDTNFCRSHFIFFVSVKFVVNVFRDRCYFNLSWNFVGYVCHLLMEVLRVGWEPSSDQERPTSRALTVSF